MIYHQDTQLTIHNGDALTVMQTMAAESVQCCVTSPPYYGLRDYGTGQWEGGNVDCDHIKPITNYNKGFNERCGNGDGTAAQKQEVKSAGQYSGTCKKCGAIRTDQQIGMEETPELFIARLVDVFREVRRVLKDDGVLWVNIGDSYAGSGRGNNPNGKQGTNKGTSFDPTNSGYVPDGCKAKDLIGIPWALATALRDPYYTGRIKRERDRVWLAAMMDGEGSISGYEHERKDDGRTRTGLNICITNSNQALLDECSRIWPASTHNHVPAGAGHLGERRIDRWIPQGAAEKAQLLEEIYPYLIAKKKQAIVGWNLAQAMIEGKRDGHSSRAETARAKRIVLVNFLRALNAGDDVDLPSWVEPITDIFRPGFYLRSEIIWHKLNPMPESVTDRPTKAHEQIFLLSKSARYFYDSEAVKEPCTEAMQRRAALGHTRGANGKLDQSRNDAPTLRGQQAKTIQVEDGRNRRSVWSIASAPYADAHFATFPPALIEPCILAGSRVGDTVLDPFGGSGTTAEVANKFGRKAVLIELNPDYCELAMKRNCQKTLFAGAEV